MHFHIHGQTYGHQPIPGRWPDLSGQPVLCASTAPGDAGYRLLVTPEAVEQLDAHIGLGLHTPQNDVEQGGILLGNLLYDAEKRLTFARVTHVVSGESTSADGVHVNLDTAAWGKMLSQAGRVAPADAVVVGWYHTHPGQLQVFMSSADLSIQQQLFHEDWLFSLVVNPQKVRFGVWHGANAQPCAGWLMHPPVRAEEPALDSDLPFTQEEWALVRRVLMEMQWAAEQARTAPVELEIVRERSGALRLRSKGHSEELLRAMAKHFGHSPEGEA